MLAISRHVGEEIVIGDPKQPIGTIRVVQVGGDKVRLSFDFPREISIHRSEVAAAIRNGEPEKRKVDG